jgi:hypothetical protein
MAKFKATDRLTFGVDGSIIMVPNKDRESYFKQKFGLEKIKEQSFVKRKKMYLDEDGNEKPGMTGNERYTPSSSDLVRVPFRALSATVVAAGTWRATDFTDEAVLRRSVKKLIGKSAFVMHWQYTDECIGAIETASWSEKTAQDGLIIPAGIDIVYLINGEHNEKLCSNLLMEPPGIYSNSVTVEFEWEPSHDNFKDEDQFMQSIGQVHADGRMVARKVIDLVDYHESSICWLGADPFAKMKDKEGKLINPEEGAVFNNANQYVKEMYTKERHFFASYSFKKEGISLTNKIVKNLTDMEKILLELARKSLGLAADAEVTQAHIDSLVLGKKDDHTLLLSKSSKVEGLEREVTELKAKGDTGALTTELEKVKGEKTVLEGEKVSLTEKVGTLEPMALIGTAHLAAKRAEVVRLYKAGLKGVAEDATMLDNFTKSDSKGLDSFLTMFTKGVAEKFEAKCATCGTTEIEFRSTFVEAGKEGDKQERRHLGQQVRS